MAERRIKYSDAAGDFMADVWETYARVRNPQVWHNMGDVLPDDLLLAQARLEEIMERLCDSSSPIFEKYYSDKELERWIDSA